MMKAQTNPLIPMGAITGDPSRDEITAMLRQYAEVGIEQFLIYPRDGSEVEYMSERWLEICGDIIREADRLGMSVWLYDEFNWPSGTCRGEVIRVNPEFAASCIVVRDGKCEIVRSPSLEYSECYADILNPDAVDCFIKNTHQVYYDRFGEYFGRVIKGIFTDEPGMSYFCQWGSLYPYTKGIEELYQAEYDRNLFDDILSGGSEVDLRYYRLLSRLFRGNFIDRIENWCKAHSIALTGHLFSEHSLNGASRSNGSLINALRGFGLPGVDEIQTCTKIDSFEFQTFGAIKTVVSETRRGALAELFALGPSDLPPSRIEQMIWLAAMFGIDHYVLAVSAFDARGNVKKNIYYNPMNYTSPWFCGYKELGESAAAAADYAAREMAVDLYVRYPVTKSWECLHMPDNSKLYNQRLDSILRLLTRKQVQWQLIDDDSALPDGAIVIDVGREDYSESEVLGLLESEFKPEIYVTERGGGLADDLLLRRFTDGDVVILDLCDSDTARELILCQKDKRIPFKLAGRGHCIISQSILSRVVKACPKIVELSPVFTLELSNPNLLRCNLSADPAEYSFTVSERLDNIRLLVRDYGYDGQLTLDGQPMTFVSDADGLLPIGFGRLYRRSEGFSLERGVHTVRSSCRPRGENYLPTCFICGGFAADRENRLFRLPETCCGRLDNTTLPGYVGKISLTTEISLPEDCRYIEFDSSSLYTRVYINGQPLGGQLSGYRWSIPDSFAGCDIKLTIEQYTSIGPLFGEAEGAIVESENVGWTSAKKWFPGRYERCGISALSLLGE